MRQLDERAPVEDVRELMTIYEGVLRRLFSEYSSFALTIRHDLRRQKNALSYGCNQQERDYGWVSGDM